MKQHYPRKSRQIAAVDIFCGAGGMTRGFLDAGLKVVAGVDNDPACAHAFEANNLGAKFIHEDIRNLRGSDIRKLYPSGSIRLLAGCAPCQPFSKYTQGKDADARWWLLLEFARLVKKSKPHLVCMENVAELETRGASVLNEFTRMLERHGYHWDARVVDCSDYGVPQRRRRFVLLASRIGEIGLPSPSVQEPVSVEKAIKGLPRLRAGKQHFDDLLHVASALNPTNLERLRYSRPGRTWRDWPSRLRLRCHKKKSGASYTGVYGRMRWDQPAPTMTTLCYGIGNGRFGHPSQCRAISLREAALLQSFPPDYQFNPPDEPVSMRDAGRMIGNAVPVKLAFALGRAFRSHIVMNRK